MTELCPICNHPVVPDFKNQGKYLCKPCRKRFTQAQVIHGSFAGQNDSIEICDELVECLGKAEIKADLLSISGASYSQDFETIKDTLSSAVRYSQMMKVSLEEDDEIHKLADNCDVTYEEVTIAQMKLDAIAALHPEITSDCSEIRQHLDKAKECTTKLTLLVITNVDAPDTPKETSEGVEEPTLEEKEEQTDPRVSKAHVLDVIETKPITQVPDDAGELFQHVFNMESILEELASRVEVAGKYNPSCAEDMRIIYSRLTRLGGELVLIRKIVENGE